MTVKASKLISMAQQIADNNSFTPDLNVVAAKVSDHMQRFWDPRMKQQIIDYAKSDEAEMSAVVALAVSQLRVHT